MDAEFNNIDLSWVKFSKEIDFRGARFFGILELNNAQFNGTVEFDVSKPNIQQFNNGFKIKFNEAHFHNLILPWENIKKYIEAANPNDYQNLIRNYTRLGWFSDADDCYFVCKNVFWYDDYLKFYSKYLDCTGKITKIDNLTKIKFNELNKYIFPLERGLLYLLSGIRFGHLFSLFLYGHGVKLKLPILTGFGVIIASAIFYVHNNQATILEGFKFSLKIFFSTTEVGNLTGICEWWSIAERVLGAILLITSLVVLARKTLR